ncbi:uncharacterized protein VICG_00886 [Vittaforma corneae ATCC 50505]|uniref:NOT2/NOT3/NOT5 C-terminal domain-containing protein n=1 Tax=Vittaforma corneae (strain ATCC 50505) TaxID=993615 RepID=L2GN44_VITCO|nr:uncharacterized protein VICG_00886 [Vittaforma corneae ATCC 50505]ELA42039.1 hypothetical protein VICG_00886 [Vittaforma corneae ATCC 50505]
MDKNPKKSEDLSPEEMWKKVSQQLSSKKYESASKLAYTTMFDLSSISAEIQKIKAEKRRTLEKLEKIEIENSMLNKPYFKQIEPMYPIRKRCKVPAFFPKHSFMHFNNPNFYKRFDLDTLFFIFYYFKGHIQQTYAAIRLKHYAWRYHLKYKMWFQRLDEPKLITSEYEKGEFLFFDYETAWNFMKKNDFVFEYFYLEHHDYH